MNSISSKFFKLSQLSPLTISWFSCTISIRNGRRTCHKLRSQVTRKIDSFWHARELTAENKSFLQQSVIETYKSKCASPLKEPPPVRHPWTISTKRTGVLAIKIGVQPQWTKEGKKFHTTLLQVLDNHVIRYVPPEDFQKFVFYNKEKYSNNTACMIVGAISTDPFKFSKMYCDLFSDSGLPPKKKLTRFLVTPDAELKPGTPLYATHFKVGQYIDAQAKTIGHGFQGVVKRWGFKGGPGSHGTTKWHRRPGNIGGGRGKGKVFKGKKLPGHMGMEWRTTRGLKIWRINTKHNVLYVHGCGIPGPTHCYVRLYDTLVVKHREKMVLDPPYMPTHMPENSERGQLDEDVYDDQLFQLNQPTITFESTEINKN